MKVLLFAASFPPPSEGGSIEYLHQIVSNVPPHSVVIHTGNLDPVKAKDFDRTVPQRVIRSWFIPHALQSQYVGTNPLRILFRKFSSLGRCLLWILVGFGLIVRERPDVVWIGEQNYAAVSAWCAQRLMGIPYLFFTYAEEITMISKHPWHQKVHLGLLRGAQAVVTVCEYTRRLLVTAGVPAKNITIVLPAVGNDKKKTVTSAEIEIVRQKLQVTGGQRVLLTAASLAPRKNHAAMIGALPIISSQIPEVRYIIAGGGPLESVLKQQVREAGLESQVTFMGRVSDMELSCLYEICEVFVLPNCQVPDTLETEGCPTVFFEAGAHGKPVVGGSAGGVADAIRDGSTGFIVDGNDKEALARKICILLADPDSARRMGKQGRDFAAGMTPERNAARVWEITQNLGKKPRSSEAQRNNAQGEKA